AFYPVIFVAFKNKTMARLPFSQFEWPRTHWVSAEVLAVFLHGLLGDNIREVDRHHLEKCRVRLFQMYDNGFGIRRFHTGKLVGFTIPDIVVTFYVGEEPRPRTF